MAESQVPVIDVRHLVATAAAEHDATEKRQQCVAAIGQALVQGMGFFQIVGHGIDKELIDQVWDATQAFFALPQSEKDKIHRSPQNSRGYFRLLSELTKQKPDWKEGYDVSDLDAHLHGIDGENQWPAQPHDFRSVFEAYLVEMRKLARILTSAIACSLGLDENYFLDNYLRDTNSFVRLNHYPPCPDPTDKLGISPHTDAGILTILMQNNVAGLQVMSGGTWITVAPHPDAFVINIGDMLQVWTNDKYKANLHRVLASDQERYSIPYFFNPSPAVDVEPLDICVDAIHPRKYKTINWGNYRRERAKGDIADYGEEIQISQFTFF
eukprot:TRINITY_DN5284_c0_g1_i1.p1 TRINITY_DN5284_c0_g1~~TRINITY_DN5284_c0_g1_i1.p1  ORF type:complete len:325 (+),score=39.96 TRINITY_DN5284_c0_g1_i1:14-988(+)